MGSVLKYRTPEMDLVFLSVFSLKTTKKGLRIFPSRLPKFLPPYFRAPKFRDRHIAPTHFGLRKPRAKQANAKSGALETALAFGATPLWEWKNGNQEKKGNDETKKKGELSLAIIFVH